MTWWLWVVMSFISTWAFADTANLQSTMSWSPPASDSSVYFLGTIFGQVDNVLYGSGSQIIGKMFAIFNAAVLSLGGLLIAYIIIVSTMNTAHDGEMLGKKFNSIWVPLRTTIGLGLLIPKASGYCLMQVIVMWIVVQGVGVADKVWNAALDYLNVGGVIIHATMTPVATQTNGVTTIQTGAANLLAAQVCMIGLQTVLENLKSQYTSQKSSSNSGPCAGTPGDVMASFCNTSVPNFLTSVDIYGATVSGTTYTVQMPSFDSSTNSYYAALNGICGSLTWNSMSDSSSYNTLVSSGQLTTDQEKALDQTRSMAVEAMYQALATTAQTMVKNDPLLTATTSPTTTNATSNAVEQFGIPYTQGGQPCTTANASAPQSSTTNSNTCNAWGSTSSSSSAGVLFTGNEFQGAVSAYNSVMAPLLNLQSEAKNSGQAKAEREFINASKSSGWLLAGSYFFNLVQLNGNAATPTTVDNDSGLGATVFSTAGMASAFSSSGTVSCTGNYANLCTFVNGVQSSINNVIYLINNGNNQDPALSMPSITSTASYTAQPGSSASSVYGFINNSLMIALPSSLGTTGPTITTQPVKFNFSVAYQLPTGLSQGRSPSVFGYCLGGLVTGFFKSIMLPIFQSFLLAVETFANVFLNIFVVTPLTVFAQVFITGVSILSTPGINPIIGLSMMGLNYINVAMSMWVLIGLSAVAGSYFPSTYALIIIFLPLFLAWLGVMLTIAFTTVYYVPFLPYMMFTFGSIGWFIVVIEAMVAAPIVALGILHPEGHEAVGQSSSGFMILLNVFLRPVLMIFGYIFGISLSYVGVWVINSGFQNILSYMQGTGPGAWNQTLGGNPTGINWASLFGYFFSSLIYTGMYLAVVQNAFTLIAELPDKVLRWIGGQQESTGKEASQMKDEVKGKIEKAGEETAGAGSSVAKSAAGAMGQLSQKIGGGGKGDKPSDGPSATG